MSKDNFCLCGTLKQAVAVAEALYVKTAATDCPIWALQIAIAYQAMAARDLATMAGQRVAEASSLAMAAEIGPLLPDTIELAHKVAEEAKRLG